MPGSRMCVEGFSISFLLSPAITKLNKTYFNVGKKKSMLSGDKKQTFGRTLVAVVNIHLSNFTAVDMG